MQYDKSVERERANYKFIDLPTRPQLTQYEYDIGRGVHYRGVMFILSFFNLSLYAHKKGLIHSGNRGLAYFSILATSGLLSCVLSSQLFGYRTIREIEKRDIETNASGQLYNDSFKKSK